MFNLISMTGRLTADPKKGTTATNRHYCTFSVANQKTKEKALFFNCIAFEKTAEFIAQYFKKGDVITFYGSLDYYDTEKDSKKYRNYQIIVNGADFPAVSRSQNAKDPAEAATDAEW